MIIPWHETFYQLAGECVQKSWSKWEEKQFIESWKYTIPARLAYLCDVVMDVIIVPFHLLGLTFGIIKGILTCNWQTLHESRAKMMQKMNRLFLSTFGAILSPALAYRYREANLAPYIIAGRIVVILAATAYLALRK